MLIHMQVTYRPIDVYPGERTRWPKDSTFSAGWQDTLNLLDRELTFLGAKQIIFQLDLKEGEIRLDGMPRANARPMSSAVVIAFESKHGPLKFATDVFRNWQDNVRAVALGLESLRRVDRYGITKNAEQYTGWQQLGSGTPMPAAQMNFKDACVFIAHAAGDTGWAIDIENDPTFAKALYRDAVKALHPDVGGDAEDFKKLQEAMRIVEAGY